MCFKYGDQIVVCLLGGFAICARLSPWKVLFCLRTKLFPVSTVTAQSSKTKQLQNEKPLIYLNERMAKNEQLVGM